MNKHLIEVRYIPTSARKPARISLTSHWNGERVIIPVDFPTAGGPEITQRLRNTWLADNEFTVESLGQMKRGYFIIVNEFKSLKGEV
jgi:hypothetical protein